MREGEKEGLLMCGPRGTVRRPCCPRSETRPFDYSSVQSNRPFLFPSAIFNCKERRTMSDGQRAPCVECGLRVQERTSKQCQELLQSTWAAARPGPQVRGLDPPLRGLQQRAHLAPTNLEEPPLVRKWDVLVQVFSIAEMVTQFVAGGTETGC